MRATHHGPWCDEYPDEACRACIRGPAGAPDVGLWLLGRILAHGAKPRALRRGALEPLGGLGLTHADQLEVARITLELAKSKTAQPRRVR